MKQTDFTRMYLELRTKAKAIGYDFFGNQEVVDDVAQEVLLRLWKVWNTLLSPEDALRLAVALAKRECINLWRKEQHHKNIPLTHNHETIRPAPHEAHSLEEYELSEAIRHATYTLPKAEARLWRMYAEAGLQAGEIAIVTGMNVRSVSSMLSRARQHIYKLLKEGGHIDD